MDPQIFFGTETNRRDDSHQIEPRWSYYREDPLLHVFYALFHKIYTRMRISSKWKRANELFLYTHQQMIRRYGHSTVKSDSKHMIQSCPGEASAGAARPPAAGPRPHGSVPGAGQRWLGGAGRPPRQLQPGRGAVRRRLHTRQLHAEGHDEQVGPALRTITNVYLSDLRYVVDKLHVNF